MIRLRAPAKLNLYLRVLGPRPDGYHEIETIFERIDLADELTFKPHPGEVRLTCSDAALSCGEDNLVLKAARWLQSATGGRPGARIHLTKRIPIAAGLGGGSSDAAAALRGLNALWGVRLDQPALARAAESLGSDVPFFLAQSARAIGRGRGEVCEPVPCAAALAYVLVVPGERLSTKEIYAGARFDLTAPKPSSSMVVHALRNGPALVGLAKGLWNDLEPEAIRRCPVITLIRSQLCDSGCLGARVTGSGPAVYGLCTDLLHARQVAARLRHAGSPSWRIDVIQTDSSTRSSRDPQGSVQAGIGE